MVAWGDAAFGGNSGEASLKDVQKVVPAGCAFASLKSDGTVQTCGDQLYGSDSSTVSTELVDVRDITSSIGVFAAVHSDGTVVTWGHPDCGGDSSFV